MQETNGNEGVREEHRPRTQSERGDFSTSERIGRMPMLMIQVREESTYSPDNIQRAKNQILVGVRRGKCYNAQVET